MVAGTRPRSVTVCPLASAHSRTPWAVLGTVVWVAVTVAGWIWRL